MTGKPPGPDQQAREDLKRLAQPGQGALDSHMGEALPGRPGIDENDPAEVWGRRVGRTLAVIAAILAIAYIVDYLQQPRVEPDPAPPATTGERP